MSQLTATNLELLRLLNNFRFLTVPQFLRLGLVKEKTSIYRLVRRFSNSSRPYIGQKDFGFIAGRGRLHRLYYLEKKGARLLQKIFGLEEGHVNYEKTRPPFLQDYFHRVATVDFHIELDIFAEQNGFDTQFFHTYFDAEGSNRGTPPNERLRRLTKVPLGKFHLIPDAIFGVQDSTGKECLFALEVYNGRDTKRVHQQAKKHLWALEEGVISVAYESNKLCRVLLTFETESAMRSAMSQIGEDILFSYSQECFLFSTPQRLKTDFSGQWFLLNGEQVSVF